MVEICRAVFTVIDRFAVLELDSESVTFTVNVKVPGAVGVPEITPVAEVRVKPAGKLPDVTIHDA